MPTVLGVITARAGSKSIPGKNLKLLCGKPLLLYTIEAAHRSGAFDRLIISTDDPATADLARQSGCEVPFVRPAELAADTTPHLPVMQHAVGWMKTQDGYVPDYVMILQPTSPARQPRHIREAVELIVRTGADSVVGVSRIPNHFHPMRALRVDERGLARLFVTGEPVRTRAVRRQDLAPAWLMNGAIYLFRTAVLLDAAEPTLHGDTVVAYVMDERYGVSIDEPADWAAAERALGELGASASSRG